MNKAKRRTIGITIVAIFFILMSIVALFSCIATLKNISNKSYYSLVLKKLDETSFTIKQAKKEEDNIRENGNWEAFIKEAEMFEQEIKEFRKNLIARKQYPIDTYILAGISFLFSVLSFLSGYDLLRRNTWARKRCLSAAIMGGLGYLFGLFAAYKVLLFPMHAINRIQNLLSFSNSAEQTNYDYSNFSTLKTIFLNKYLIIAHLVFFFSIVLIFSYLNQERVKKQFI